MKSNRWHLTGASAVPPSEAIAQSYAEDGRLKIQLVIAQVGMNFGFGIQVFHIAFSESILVSM